MLTVQQPCADPGVFVRGGGGQVRQAKKALTTFFFSFFFFLVLSLFYRSKMVNFKEIYHFSRFQRGPTFSRGGGGSNFFQGGGGGSNSLFPIETHITSDFPGWGVRTPCPPSGSALDNATYSLYLHVPKGGSRISGNGVYMYKGLGCALLILSHFS